MDDTYLMEVIRTTEKFGAGMVDDPVHRHVQYYSKDGELLFEECDVESCDR